MRDLVDRSVAELRVQHDELAALVPGLTEGRLTGPSGASEWSVADVLSHLGSGAEIARYPLVAAVTGADAGAPANEAVWDRWNALPPAEQASSFLASDAHLVETFEGLDAEQRERTQVDLGFLPQPVPLATALGMRLNEVVLHAWDVRVALDPAATLRDEAAALLVDHFEHTMTFLLGFVGKPGDVGPARVRVGDHTIVIEDAVRLVRGGLEPTATFEGPLEAAVRLLAGRLGPEHTPEGVRVTGDVSLDDLRRVFPGY